MGVGGVGQPSEAGVERVLACAVPVRLRRVYDRLGGSEGEDESLEEGAPDDFADGELRRGGGRWGGQPVSGDLGGEVQGREREWRALRWPQQVSG